MLAHCTWITHESEWFVVIERGNWNKGQINKLNLQHKKKSINPQAHHITVAIVEKYITTIDRTQQDIQQLFDEIKAVNSEPQTSK